MSELFKTKLSIDKSTWIKVKLGDVVTEPRDTVKDFTKEQIDHVVGLEHIDAESIHLRRSANMDNSTTFTKKFKVGDVLFGRRRAYLKKAAQAKFSGICSGDITVMRVKKDLLPELLPFVINNEKFFDYAVKHSAGGLSPRVKFKDLANYEFLLPPNDQQAKLAELLWAMDGVVESELSIQLNLTMTRRCLMKRFQIGSANWHKNKLRDLMHFSYGKALKESDRIDGLFSVVSSAGIQGTHNEYLVNGPGIVVGRKGNAGEVIYVEKNFWPIDTAYFIEVKKDLKHIPIKFFYYLLQAADLKKHSIATAVPGLNRDDAMATKVYLPSEKEINLLTNEFEKIDQVLLEIDLKIECSKSLQKSLINQIF